MQKKSDIIASVGLSKSEISEYSYGEIAYKYLEYIQEALPGRFAFREKERDTATFILSALLDMGYTTDSIKIQKFSFNGTSSLHGMVFEKKFSGGEKIGTSQNIILTKKGESEKIIIVAAHYDSVETYGVDDNGSGVSIVLENAMRMIEEHTPYTIHYIFFGDEEMALWGSRYYVKSMSNIEKEETLIPTLEKAKNQKDTVVYFGDAVHLIYGADLHCCLWV